MTRRELLSRIPLAPALARAGDPDAEVAFEFLHNQILLPVQIDGFGPCRAILDSGTRGSTIDLGLAKRLRLPLGRVGGSRAQSGRIASLEELRLGPVSVRDVSALALDLAPVSRQLGRELHAVLGFGFLNGRIVQVDYLRRRVRFCRESPFSPGPVPPDSPRRASFPMRFRDGSILPVLEDCAVNGIRLAITLDTGSSLGLILFPQGIRRLGLAEIASQGNPLNAVGYFGKAQLTKGWVRSLCLKTLDLGAVEAAYVVSGYGEQESIAARGGNLGNSILQDFVLTLDYRNRVVVLESLEP